MIGFVVVFEVGRGEGGFTVREEEDGVGHFATFSVGGFPTLEMFTRYEK